MKRWVVSGVCAAVALTGCQGGTVDLAAMPSADTYTLVDRDGQALVAGVDLDAAQVLPTARLDEDGDEISLGNVVGRGPEGLILSYAKQDNGPAQFVALNESGSRVTSLPERIDTGLASSNGTMLAYLAPVTETGGSTIVLDAIDGEEKREVPIGFVPSHLAPGTGEFIAVGWLSGTLHIATIEVGSGRVRATQMAAGRPLAVADADGTVVVLVQGGSNKTVAGNGLKVEMRAAPAGSTMGAIAGQFVAFDGTEADSLVLSIARRGRVIASSPVAGEGSLEGIAVSPTGHAAALFPTEIHFLAPDGVRSTQQLPGVAKTQW